MRKENHNHKLTFEIAVCVEKDGDGFHAYCPALKGIHVDGKTEKAAVENAKTAIGLYLQSMLKHHDPIPLQPLVEPKRPSRKAKPACPAPKLRNVLVAVQAA